MEGAGLERPPFYNVVVLKIVHEPGKPYGLKVALGQQSSCMM